MMTNDVERMRARDNKRAVMDAILAAETESDRSRRALAEKVETIMQLRGMPRDDAEREAFPHLLTDYLNATYPNTDSTRCVWCGKLEAPDQCCQSASAFVKHGCTRFALSHGARGAARLLSRNWRR
jgi:hypothetical protein